MWFGIGIIGLIIWVLIAEPQGFARLLQVGTERLRRRLFPKRSSS